MSTFRRAPGRPLVLGLIAALAVSILPGAPVQSALAISPDIVISEVYGGGGNTGAPFTHDYVELYNRGASPVSLAGNSIQYASATGTGNLGANNGQLTELPAVTLQPGQYFLIQEGAGAGNGVPLPSPDLVDPTPIAMAAGAGKVAYVTGTTTLGCNGGSTPCGAEQLARIVDLVGYGNANFYETAPAPTLSNTTAAIRAGDGATDTDNNAADFVAGPPDPDSSVAEAAPTVSSTVPANTAADVPPSSNITITFSEPVNAPAAAFSIACPPGSPSLGFALSGGPTTFTLDPTIDLPANESCSVTVTASQVTDVDTNDPPDNMLSSASFGFTTGAAADACGDAATFIHDIQGSGLATPLAGSIVTIEAIVVGDYQGPGQFNGYFVQEEDVDADGNVLTSEGLFVFNTATAVSVGERVRVRGTAGEFSNLTQLSSVTATSICASGLTVTSTPVTLPVTAIADLERYEGMEISVAQELTVTEVFTLGRFGEVSLSVGGRLANPTNVVEPGDPAIALQDLNNRSRILLDDGNNQQNIDPTFYPQGGLSAANTLRVGDTLPSVTGVLDQRFGVYRVQPVDAATISFTHANPRPAAPASVGGDLQVAALNVLNYFTTLNDGPGGCGPSGLLDCRGANTVAELDRQRAKTVAEILGLDADILGLMEIQNDEGATVQDLVDALNGATAPGTYAYIDTGTIGTDAIKLALLYRPASVTPVGDHAILTSAVDSRFIDTLNRPALAQTFDAASGGRLTVVVNHLKSKGSACAGDPDTGDGQGNCNGTRTAAAEALVDWIASDPTGSGDRDVLVIGDLNSYAMEDPIDVFAEAGFTNLIDQFLGAEGYSFVFQGQTGYLDHALASPTLAAQVSGTTEWHINADEPTVLDYNVEFKTPNHVTTLYAPTAYRSSDHDPLLVGLDLLDYDFSGFFAPVANQPAVNTVNSGQTIPMRFALNGDLGLDVLFGDPTAARFTCGTGVPTGEVSTASGDLIFDPDSGTYTYEWKTAKAWSNQCRTFTLTLDDGAYRSADFNFRN